MANDTFQFALAKTYLDGEDEDKGLEGLEMMKKFAETETARLLTSSVWSIRKTASSSTTWTRQGNGLAWP